MRQQRECGCWFSAGANIREWRSLKSLQELNLKGCYKIEDAGLQGLSFMTSLTSLNLQECWQITAEGLAAISGIMAPSLAACVPSLLESTSYSAMMYLASFHADTDLLILPHPKVDHHLFLRPQESLLASFLQTFRVQHVYRIAQSEHQQLIEKLLAFSSIENGAGLRGMLDINLLGCRRVSELRPLAGLTALTGLSLRNCDGLGDASLGPLAGLLSLRSLDLSGCTHLTGAG